MMSDTEYLKRWLKRLDRHGWCLDDWRDLFAEERPQQAHLPPDAWQEFKRKFIETYGGETVQNDGLTHREFVEYLRSGRRDYEGVDKDD